jgi:hypothetical protein
MPIDYRTLKPIPMSDLFGGRLDPFQVREHIHPDVTSPTARCLFDGENYVWAFSKTDGLVALLTLFGTGDSLHILSAIETAFDTDIISDHRLQFWGFDNDAWMFGERSKKEDDRFYVELEKYLAGESCDIATNESWMTRAHIAKQLVSEARELGEPWFKTVLLQVIQHEEEARHRDEEQRRWAVKP